MRQNPHVRICGGPGSATTLVYPTAGKGGSTKTHQHHECREGEIFHGAFLHSRHWIVPALLPISTLVGAVVSSS